MTLTRIYSGALALLAIVLTGCATSKVPLTVHPMKALSSVEPEASQFQGLEFLADIVPGKLKSRVNIVYVHGIGWTENPDADQLAGDFLSGIATAYGREVEEQIIKTSCGKENPSTGKTSPHVYIKNPIPHVLETAIAGSTLELDKLVCMDKQVLEVDPSLEFVLYRVFWDDIFWNSLQFPHVGQDDDQGTSKDIARLRRKYNRRLKDELINFGISDAVMYLGAAGDDIRMAVEGALCSASLDAAGYDFERQGREITFENICTLAANTSTRSNQFAFVTESLGSKIMYDVLRRAMTDGRDTAVDDMIRGSETFMLANQIPLLSLSDLNKPRTELPPDFSPSERPKIVAMSELNDFLTYELIPFYRQLWYRSQRTDGSVTDPDDPRSRETIVRGLGFDVIDMRLEFADKVVPVLNGFSDPLEAHTGHAGQPELMRYILCGARMGKLNTQGCLATELAAELGTQLDKDRR
ncbi:hypothetical protein [Fretibacter rubidus]|uniref:hypothetical protein n=1 Tax=Fretibacter rubidus TaxID=570162 RepID=UPI00352B83F4